MKLSQLLFASSLLVGCSGESNLGDTVHSNVPAPNTRWAVSFGGDDTDFVSKLALDSTGDVIAIGQTEGHQGIDGEASIGARNTFITKRAAADGSERWKVTLKAVAGDADAIVKLTDAAVDSQDNIVVLVSIASGSASTSASTIDLGGISVEFNSTADTSGSLAYALKVSPTGQTLWAKKIAGNVEATHLALDTSDRILIAGSFSSGTVQIAGTTYVTSSPRQPFVAAYDADLAPRWSNLLPATAPDTHPSPSGIAVMGAGDLVVTYQGELPYVVPGQTVEYIPEPSWLLTRYAEDGSELHTTEFAPPTPSPNSGVYGVGVWNPVRIAADRVAISVMSWPDSYHVTTEVRTLDGNLAGTGVADMGQASDFVSTSDGTRLVGVQMDQNTNGDNFNTLSFFSVDDQSIKTSTVPFATLHNGIEGVTPLNWWFSPTAGNATTVVFGGQLGPDSDFGLGNMRAHDVAGDAFIVALDNPQ